MLSLKKSATVVAVASTMLIGTAALAQTSVVTTRSINVMGDVLDSNGQVVGHITLGTPGSTTTLVAPSVRSTVVMPTAPVAITPVPDTTVVKRTVTTTTTEAAPLPIIGERTVFMSDTLQHLLAQRRLELEQRIAALPITDSLTLRAELSRIAAIEASAIAGGNRLTFDEAIALAQDLDSLNNRVALLGGAPLNPLIIIDSQGGRQIAVRDLQLY